MDPVRPLWPEASTLDDETERLVDDLRRSPTDLAKLVTSVCERRLRAVPVSSQAITRWLRDDPVSWGLVRAWLERQSVQVVICGQP